MLGGIYGYMEMARNVLTTQETAKPAEYLDKAIGIFERTKHLTKQLLTFAKGGQPVKKGGDLVSLIKETAHFILTGSNVSPEFDFAPDLWPCDFDANMIGQVFDNIIINAKQAMHEGGSIFFTAENTGLQADEIPALKAGRYIRIKVRDTGIGIAEDSMPRIFDPFYTTKASGSGLGLATSYSIVKKHGGHIFASSEAGKGTVFHVLLPAKASIPAETTVTAGEAVNKPKGIDAGSLRVLVMDDEKYMRDMLSEMLCSLGCEVTTATDGNEALNLIQEASAKGTPFNCALMDLTIPGKMGGREAIGQLRKTDTALIVIAISGYYEDDVMTAPNRYGFNGSITKPFKRAAIEKELNRHF
jgi:CheY-like chemotaxis protein